MALLLDEAKKQLLSVGEAAQYLGVQERTIYSWASQENIPSVHMGRRLLFDQEDLDKMIEACKCEAR
jgi:excisionase family DNA binding protein